MSAFRLVKIPLILLGVAGCGSQTIDVPRMETSTEDPPEAKVALPPSFVSAPVVFDDPTGIEETISFLARNEEVGAIVLRATREGETVELGRFAREGWTPWTDKIHGTTRRYGQFLSPTWG